MRPPRRDRGSRMQIGNSRVDSYSGAEGGTVDESARLAAGGRRMQVTTHAITLASAAAVLLVGCSTNAAGSPVGHGAGPKSPTVTAAGLPAPRAAPGGATPVPDAGGIPACPVFDAWGKAPTDSGIFITYWDDQPDYAAAYATALVRTTFGTDYAKSAGVDPVQQPVIFDFPNIDGATVKEVLITTNVRRCFATPDPATSGR